LAEYVLELYPQAEQKHPLEGLYLQSNLKQQYKRNSTTFVYANFISSLDGRIAVPHADQGLTVPEKLGNPRDWRLFQELAIQADILLSSGRYLRDYDEGRAQEILRVYDDPNLSDLADWRLDNGLDRHPAIAVISASLDFPVPPALIEGGRKVIVLTTERSPNELRQALELKGLQVFNAGKKQVEGARAIQILSELGYCLIYSAAGPKVLHMLLMDGVLDRLYLTFAARILGGNPFATILEGPLLPKPADFILRTLYLDSYAPGPGGQLFASYDYEPCS
jgi:riboflavin biosynthesis pyrimidine reductase